MFASKCGSLSRPLLSAAAELMMHLSIDGVQQLRFQERSPGTMYTNMQEDPRNFVMCLRRSISGASQRYYATTPYNNYVRNYSLWAFHCADIFFAAD